MVLAPTKERLLMNRLQLAQQLRRDCGISGSDSTTINATGEWADVVNWIDRAWQDIQMDRPNWLWMRETASFVTIAEQAEYPIDAAPLSLTNFASWVPGSFRIYKDTIGNETILAEWDSYDQFRNVYLIGTNRTSYGYPSSIVVSPTKSLILASPPNDASYTVSGDYHKLPTVLSVDADEPNMPARFHMLVVYRAMKFSGYKESASELLALSKEERIRLTNLLEIDQLPKITCSGSFI